MEVAQNGGQAAHVIGMRMAEGDRIQMANAARPERGRDNFFADIEILRSLTRAAAKSSAIDEQCFAVRGDQQQRIALAYVDGFDEQRGAGMVERARSHDGECGERKSNPGKAALPACSASQHDGSSQQCAECGGLPDEWRGNAEVAQRKRAEEMHQAHAAMQKRGSAHRGHECGGRPDEKRQQGEQRRRHEHGEQGQNEDVDGQGKERDAMEVEGHGQRHGEFDDAGNDEQFGASKSEPNRTMEKRARQCAATARAAGALRTCAG